MRSRWLRCALFLSCHVVVHSVLVNVTVDDTDPSILYIPDTDWSSSLTACPSSCLLVDTSNVHNKTYHTGTHVLNDTDDFPSPSSTAGTALPSTTTDDDNSGSQKGKGKSSSGLRLSKRLDPDDPGFVDTPVTAQFKFNGTAIYLFGIQPHGPPSSPLAPTNMNLSFTLDNKPLTPYLHSAVADGTTGFTTNFSVLAIDGLPLAPHVLLVNIGVNSSFLFDYMIYTTQINGTTSSASPLQTAAASTQTETTASKKHGVATFAGAVGGSLGVVTVFAIGLFLSIWWRRRKSALRERRDREAQQEERRTMVGPQPFIPRYFPGTVPPPYTPVFDEDVDDSVARPSTELPGYSPPPRPAHGSASVPLGGAPNNTNSGTGTNNNVAPLTTLTYADLPPLTLPVDDDAALVPPPSFPEAIAAPTILTVAPPPMTLTPPHSATSLSPTRTSLTSSSAFTDSHSSSLDEPPLSESRNTTATNPNPITVPVPLHLSDPPVTPGSRPASHSRSSSISRPLSSLVMTSPPESEIGGSLRPTARW